MGNRDIEEAIQYHNGTKHSYVSVHHDRFYLDWSNRPLPFKIYRSVPTITLPEPQSPEGAALSAISTLERPGPEKEILDVELLAQMLFYSAGLIRKVRYGDEEFFFRSAASAGALYPTEMYLVSSHIQGLAAGVYHFSPANLALHQLRTGDYRNELVLASGQRAAASPVTIVFSSIFWRSAWKYRARSYRYCYWDSGMIAANLLAVAASHGIPSKLIAGFADDKVNHLLGLDGENEAAIFMVSMGRTAGPPQPLVAEAVPPIHYEVEPLSPEQAMYPEIHRIHKASYLASMEEASSWARAPLRLFEAQAAAGPAHELEPLEADTLLKPSLGEVIWTRGSTRRFAREPVSFSQISCILWFATRGVPADFSPEDAGSLLDIYVIVNDVQGIRPGSFYFSPGQKSMILLKAGMFRPMAGYLCLEQPLAQDASFVVFFLSNLRRVLKAYGNRGYRIAQLESGIIGGKMYLCAYALGLGASGLTFYDDEVTDFFSPHAAGKEPMFVMALGVPAYKKRKGRVGIWRPLAE